MSADIYTAPAQDSLSDGLASRRASSDQGEVWASIANRLESVNRDFKRLTTDGHSIPDEHVAECLRAVINDFRVAIAADRAASLELPTQLADDPIEDDASLHDAIHRDNFLVACTNVLELIKARGGIEGPGRSSESCDRPRSGHAQIFRVRRDTTLPGDTEVKQSILYLNLHHGAIKTDRRPHRFITFTPPELDDKSSQLRALKLYIDMYPVPIPNANVLRPSSVALQKAPTGEYSLDGHHAQAQLWIPGPDASRYPWGASPLLKKSSSLNEKSSLVFAYEVGLTDSLSNCPEHPDTSTSGFICAHDPLDASAPVPAIDELFVSITLKFFAHMPTGIADTNLVVLCEHAAAQVVRDKLLELTELRPGLYNLEELFTVLLTRENYEHVMGYAYCSVSDIFVDRRDQRTVRTVHAPSTSNTIPSQAAGSAVNTGTSRSTVTIGVSCGVVALEASGNVASASMPEDVDSEGLAQSNPAFKPSETVEEYTKIYATVNNAVL
ncbi:hypothetical protein EIP86_011587 [Pleurotus ostreatoroseus]|nr:hypothetical protein EIP86_011587 [Pleurotus ostreatoroseus]